MHGHILQWLSTIAIHNPSGGLSAMPMFRPLKSIVSKFFGESDDPVSAVGRPNYTRSVANQDKQVMQSDIAGRLADLFAQNRVVSAGKLHVINLDGLRDKFGDQWNAKLERVQLAIEGALHRHLAPQDFFSRVGEGAYAIIFDQLVEPEASVKCGLIAQEVLHKLFGNNDDAKDVVIQTAVARLDGTVDLEASNPLNTIEDLLKGARHYDINIDRSPDTAAEFLDVDNLPPKTPTIASLGKAGVDLEHLLSKAEKRLGNWQAHLPAQGRTIYSPEEERRKAPRNTAVDMTPPSVLQEPQTKEKVSVRFADVRDLVFSFQPLWFAPKTAVIGYHSRVIFRTEHDAIPAEELVAEGSLAEISLTVDRLLMRGTLTHLAKLLAEGGKALVVVSIHLATVNNPSGWRQLENLLTCLTAEMRGLLIFELIDAHVEVSDTALLSVVRRLSRYARGVIVRLPIFTLGVDRYAQVGFSGISTSLRGMLNDEADLIRMIQTLAEAARHHQMQRFLLDTETRSLMIAALGHGFEYVGGSVIAEDLAQPAKATAFTLRDVYQNV